MANGNPLLPGGTGPTPNDPARRINLPSNPPSGGPNGLMALGDGPDNTDMQPGGGPGQPPQRTGGPKGPVDDLMAQHDYAKSVYDSVTKARNLIDHIRREMDQLTRKGDTVAPEDVIAAAGRVVGHGVGAREMAMLLADMPTQGGQGLAGWLAIHDANITQQEQHITTVQALTQHRMGQAALRVLAGLHTEQRSKELIRGMGSLAPTARPTTGPPGMATGASTMANPLQAGGPSAGGGEEGGEGTA